MWRDIARPIIADVLAKTKGQPEEEIRKALFVAYPFGERKMHPYRIWINEIKRQRWPKATEPLDVTPLDLFES